MNKQKNLTPGRKSGKKQADIIDNIIDPEKDIAKVIFPLTTRFGQTCGVCGQFHFLDEITIDYDFGWICFDCLDSLEKMNGEEILKGGIK